MSSDTPIFPLFPRHFSSLFCGQYFVPTTIFMKSNRATLCSEQDYNIASALFLNRRRISVSRESDWNPLRLQSSTVLRNIQEVIHLLGKSNWKQLEWRT
jgi:hypothetical protein